MSARLPWCESCISRHLARELLVEGVVPVGFVDKGGLLVAKSGLPIWRRFVPTLQSRDPGHTHLAIVVMQTPHRDWAQLSGRK